MQLVVYTGKSVPKKPTKVKPKKTLSTTDSLQSGAVARTNPMGKPFTKETAALVNKVEVDPKAAENPRQAVLSAFGKVGGVRWLVKYAKRDPKGFAGLLAKAMPTEVNVQASLNYAPKVIPVEQREPIPGEFTVISEVVTQVTEELDPFT